MKMKSFAMLFLTGLLATSVMCIAPVKAEEMSNGQPMQALADNSAQNNTGMSPNDNMNIPPSDGVGSSPSDNLSAPPTDNMANPVTPPPSDMNSNIGAPSDSSVPPSSTDQNNASMDQGSPDTATGDDDY